MDSERERAGQALLAAAAARATHLGNPSGAASSPACLSSSSAREDLDRPHF